MDDPIISIDDAMPVELGRVSSALLAEIARGTDRVREAAREVLKHRGLDEDFNSARGPAS